MDLYDLRARYAPAALAIAPMVLLAVPPLLGAGLSGRTLALGGLWGACAVGLGGALARRARERGLAVQERLWERWGGAPTTAMLRHRDGRLNRHTKAGYHALLRRLGKQFHIPGEEEERADPSAADERFEAAIDEARRRAKARRIASVHRENVSYGAARNALGMRPLALWVAAGCIVAQIAAVSLRMRATGSASIGAADLGVLAALAAAILLWLVLVTPGVVLRHAEAYARTLFEALESVVARQSAK